MSRSSDWKSTVSPNRSVGVFSGACTPKMTTGSRTPGLGTPHVHEATTRARLLDHGMQTRRCLVLCLLAATTVPHSRYSAEQHFFYCKSTNHLQKLYSWHKQNEKVYG